MIRAIKEYIKSHRHLRSLRLLVFVIILLISIIFGGVMRRNFINTFREKSIQNETNDICEEMKVLARHMISVNYLNEDNRDVINGEMSVLADLYRGRVLVLDKDCIIINDSDNTSLGQTFEDPNLSECFKGNDISAADEKAGIITVGVAVNEYSLIDNSNTVIGVIYAIIPMDNIFENVKFMEKQAWTVEMLMLIAIMGISFIVAALISKPLVKLTKAIESVASFEEGNITVTGYQETEGIVTAFNSQRSRLKTLDDSRQEFVSNVSHELRTPITAMKVLAETLVFQEDAPIEMYKDFMNDIVEEVDRENKIITDLLELVNMDKGKEGLNIAHIDINEMIAAIIKRVLPIADHNSVEINFESEKNVTADVDETKMSLALTNLVENGIKYNKQGGYVRIVVSTDHQHVIIKISDSGIGIPEEARSHIFERFYRVDKSHSKEIGGTGLGLPIARKIILLHRGSVTVESKIDMGTTFTVKIPVIHV